MLDSRHATSAALRDRYRRLCIARDNVRENIERMEAHQRELVAQINDCLAVARVFDWDLGHAPLSDGPDSISQWSRPFHELSVQPRHGVVTIRGLVLDAVEKAYPNPIRSGDIHRQVVDRGYAIHEKTVGMSLYRWSLQNRVRRDGRDWYFVPPGNRPPTIGSDHQGTESASELGLPRFHRVRSTIAWGDHGPGPRVALGHLQCSRMRVR